MRLNKSHLIIELTQTLMWACVFLLPSVIYFIFFHDIGGGWWTFKIMLKLALPAYVTYLLNYHLFVRKLLFAGRYTFFVLSNILLLAASFFFNFYNQEWTTAIPDQIPEGVPITIITAGFTGFIALEMVFQIMVTLMAIGMRFVIKWNDENQALEEERRRNAEAELNWLKNQLNPHFLFNTLNNISSLTQIDPDKAQESIGQLSELLRYALYESNVNKVSLEDEVEFMKNYIDLMSLRCNDMTSIETRFDSMDRSLSISPLLFISLIENAFKHGTSAHKESFVKIDMGLDGDDLIFSCENSLHERTSLDRSGSGIGLENMMRRLELLYPGAYSYNQFIDKDAYVAMLRIKDIRNNG
ncbi:MAG: histidine kinase [Bacteroidales bacterium]|nr:histidine kinase [Bacteroidales bacterium]